MNGRKRHALVDTNGLLLKAKVHAANVTESDGGKLLLKGLKPVFPRLDLIWADGGYKQGFVDWVQEQLGWRVEVVKPRHPRGFTAQAMRDLLGNEEFERRFPKGFQLLPRRWVVERTFSWFGKQRRLSKDYEFLPETEESWLYLTMTRLMARRLALA